MPRLPRPSSLKSPSTSRSVSSSSTKPIPISHPAQDHDPGESSGSSSSRSQSGVSTDDEEDVDTPRVAQWLDEEDLEESGSSEEEDVGMSAHPQDVKSLKDGLQSLPFGALRKAQRALAATAVDSDSNDGSDSDGPPFQDGDAPPQQQASHGKDDDEVVPKTKKAFAKRSSKHAPTEVTSKRPVSRHRTAVEVQKLEARDPRFLPMAGDFDAKRFRDRYNFLANLHKDELQTLRDNLKRARKLLPSSPRDLRQEREQEVERLERALKRAESSVNKDKREKIEQEAMTKAARAEREKRKQGKGAYYMKNADKKNLLLKARYDAMAAEGGGKAVRKAIEKKQKKISQKETKARPFAKPNGAGYFPSSRKRFSGGDGDDVHREKKRRKVG